MNCRVIPGSGIKNEIDKAETTCNDSTYKMIRTIDMETGTDVSDVLDMSNNISSNTQPTLTS